MRRLDPRLLRRARHVRGALVSDAVIGVAAAFFVLGQSVLVAKIAAEAFGGASLTEVRLPLLLLLGATAGRAASTWGFEVVGRRAASGVLSKLRTDLVADRLADTPGGSLDLDTGELATAAVGGIDALEVTFARYLPQAVLAAIVPVAVLVIVAVIDPLSALIMLCTLPLVPLFMWLVGRHTQRQALERRRAMAHLAGHFLDVIRGLPTLRAFGRGPAQAASIGATSDRSRRATMATLRSAFVSGAVLELAATLGIALVAVTVGVRLVSGDVSFRAALTVLILAPELYLPLRGLAAQFHASADGLSVAERLLDAVDTTVSATPRTAAAPDPRDAAIRFVHVSYSYPTRDAPALETTDLCLMPGEFVAVAGPSGAGKSTLAALLLGLLQPTSGRIDVGAVNLGTADLAAWRSGLTWVPQRPTLVRGTVADNIRLSEPASTDAQVRRAAEAVGADDFILGWPDGYDTVVGGGGRPMSSGQRQRIALARAFLRDASLVILDEPTANLDDVSSEVVGEAITRFARGRTVLLVTHRSELAGRASRIVRLEGGRSSASP